MIFFTRQLHAGLQPGSGWEKRAEKEWVRRERIYRNYFELINEFLPAQVKRLIDYGLHDGRVESFEGGPETFRLDVNCQNALGPFRGKIVSLEFSGVSKLFRSGDLAGSYWLYEEVHLAKGGFTLNVLFDPVDFEICATGLVIKTSATKQTQKRSKWK